jgi:hypothetical protein
MKGDGFGKWRECEIEWLILFYYYYYYKMIKFSEFQKTVTR